jgi:protein gp37
MGTKTGIAWTEATWNPIRGCSLRVEVVDGQSVLSEGCRNCYAKAVAGRFCKAADARGNPEPYHGLAILQGGTAHWTGKIRFIEKHLMDPVTWKKPRMIFVNSMSDLFHENLGFDLIDEILYVMQRANWHIYQVLTKRAGRMLEYMMSSDVRRDLVGRMKHVHWGVSVENPMMAQVRIPILTQLPVSTRWVSLEPLLAAVSLAPWIPHEFSLNPKTGLCEDCRMGKHETELHDKGAKSPIHWLVVGGESGHEARPMDPIWALGLLAQARAAGIPFFFKQQGEWAPVVATDSFQPLRDRNGQPFMHKVGKAAAGDRLFGEKYQEYPAELPETGMGQ